MRLPVMHRVSSISDSGIRIKGDSNPSEDSWVAAKTWIRGQNVLISENPVVIRNLGAYFIVDTSSEGRMYGPEFDAASGNAPFFPGNNSGTDTEYAGTERMVFDGYSCQRYIW